MRQRLDKARCQNPNEIALTSFLIVMNNFIVLINILLTNGKKCVKRTLPVKKWVICLFN